LAIIKALEDELSISGLAIKWPNDIYFDNKKLAGILLENQARSSNQAIVIGVGVNYALNEDMVCETPWVDLAALTKELPDIRNLTASIIQHVIALTERFESKVSLTFKWIGSAMTCSKVNKLILNGRATILQQKF
jgi:BirA family biotin operon repressor/biotin-[acetyl-CoA-carboxylase] ligase